jgi:hypothetical protein
MRLCALALSCLLPAAAFADSSVTTVDDEPISHDAARAETRQPATRHGAMRQAAIRQPTPAPREDWRSPPETGQLRSARVDTPMPAPVDDGPSVTREHDVAPAPAVAATATDGDVMAELAEHQLVKEAKRHQRAVDACVAAARKRTPSAAGSLTLDFDIADRKVQSVRVSDDAVHDPALATCVSSVARSFSFAIASAHLRWPVAVR